MTTATHESLFIKKLDPSSLFEKEATIARMPDDDRKWPEVVLSELHKQLPFMSGMDIALNFTRIQPEAGYGFGYAIVRGQKHVLPNPTKPEDQVVKIPIIVADRHLDPFHVFNFQGKTIPLTQGRFEEALHNPRVFAGPAKTPKTQKSLIDQLYPPYQQRQGFGRVVDGSGMSGSSMGINKTANQAPPPRPSFGESMKDEINPLHAGSMTHTPAMALGTGAAGAGLGKLVGGNKGAFIGAGVGAGLGALKGIYNDHRAGQKDRQALKDRMVQRGVIKQAQAPAMVQNPMETMSPNQLKRLATLKQYEGIDRARSQMSSRDKQKQVLDNTGFSAGAGTLLAGATSALDARRAGQTLSAANLGKAGLRGALTGTALSLAGQGYRGLKGKLRERDREKDQYAQYLNNQQSSQKMASYNKYLMGAKK